MQHSYILVRILVSLVTLSSYFALDVPARAQVPVIDIQSDLDVVGINEALDVTASNTWTSQASAPTHRFDFAIAALMPNMTDPPLIYVAGGKVFRDQQPVRTLESFNPATHSWTTGLTVMPTRRALAGAAALNGSMFVVGGAGPSGPVSTVEAYHPPTNTWTTEAKLRTARFGPAVAVASDGTKPLLFAIGGANNSGMLSSVEAFNSLSSSWSFKAAMPTARKNAVVGVVDGKIYVIGGHDGLTPLNVVEKYDPVTNSWTTGLSPMPKTQFGGAGAVVNGLIYVSGGVDNDAVTNTPSTLVQTYDPSSDTWSIGPNMPSARSGHGAAVVDNVLYAIGGRYFSVARVGQVFVYQILASESPTSFNAMPLPSDLMVDPPLGLIFGKPVVPEDTVVTTLSAFNGQGPGTAATRLTVVDSLAAGLLASADSESPTIASASSVTGRAGDDQFSFQVLVEGASEAAVLSAGDLPVGVTFDSTTGVIAGSTSTVEGTSSVELTLQDGSFPAVTQHLQLTFTSNSNVPVITSPESATLVPGQFFTYTVTTDPIPGVSFSFIGTDGVREGALPLDLGWDGTSVISGFYNPSSSASQVRDRGPAARPWQKQIDTIKIRPPNAVIEMDANTVETATGASLTAVKPLNLFEVSAVSRLTQTIGGITTAYDIPLPLQGSPDASGVECRDGKGKFQVVVTFPTAITDFTSGKVNVVGIGTPLQVQSIINEPDNNEVTINLRNASDVQRLIITLNDMTVDGGANQYTVVVPMGLLIADRDGNGIVEPADYPTIDTAGPVNATNFRWDFNWSGTVNKADLTLAKQSRGHQLPP